LTPRVLTTIIPKWAKVGLSGYFWGKEVGILFRGEFALNLDSKGRLAVPSRFRERLGDSCNGKLIITISLFEPCLVVYPMGDWQELEDELGRLPAFDAKAQAIKHLLIGHAAECDLDGNGRVLLSQSLREFAGLDKRVRMVGQVRKFELWDESRWTERRKQLLAQVEELKEEPSEALRTLIL